MKYDNQLRYAVHIIKQYDGRFPLSVWLKDFFREHKQMGSRDRKTLAHLVYGYFRLGSSSFDTIEERVLAGLALSAGSGFSELLDYFRPPVPAPDPSALFPWTHLLSKNINQEKFCLSFLQQPDLFIRIRPGKKQVVTDKLKFHGVDFTLVNDSCISMPNTTKADSILLLNSEAVIQDLSSQKVEAFMKDLHPVSVWDCCAASGGKSIMAYDLLGEGIALTVSDVRQSIIKNLHDRFKEAGIKTYDAFVADLSDPGYAMPDKQYDLIIADVPCSGSGTWSRTPEQLCFFDPSRLLHYTTLQQKIVSAVVPALKPGGILLYITCSVFESENEGMVSFLKETNPGLNCIKAELIKGYEEKADTMFAACFTN